MRVSVDYPIGEFEVLLSGSPQPAEPDVGISSSYFDDVAVEELYFQVPVRGKSFSLRWKHVNILEGLDAKAKDIVLANVQACLKPEELQEALASEADD